MIVLAGLLYVAVMIALGLSLFPRGTYDISAVIEIVREARARAAVFEATSRYVPIPRVSSDLVDALMLSDRVLEAQMRAVVAEITPWT